MKYVLYIIILFFGSSCASFFVSKNSNQIEPKKRKCTIQESVEYAHQVFYSASLKKRKNKQIISKIEDILLERKYCFEMSRFSYTELLHGIETEKLFHFWISVLILAPEFKSCSFDEKRLYILEMKRHKPFGSKGKNDCVTDINLFELAREYIKTYFKISFYPKCRKSRKAGKEE